MFCKCQVSWILPLLILSFIFLGIVYGIPFARAQQDGTNFLAYTNTELGFTIKYPSDWTVENANISGIKGTTFTSSDKSSGVLVDIQDTPGVIFAKCKSLTG
jgi:hypothetical protein